MEMKGSRGIDTPYDAELDALEHEIILNGFVLGVDWNEDGSIKKCTIEKAVPTKDYDAQKMADRYTELYYSIDGDLNLDLIEEELKKIELEAHHNGYVVEYDTNIDGPQRFILEKITLERVDRERKGAKEWKEMWYIPPTYRAWKYVPDGLLTERQLAKEGLSLRIGAKPNAYVNAQYRGQWRTSKLYHQEDAVPMATTSTKRIGTFSVETGTCWIGDPCYFEDTMRMREECPSQEILPGAHPELGHGTYTDFKGYGVEVSSGFGDGTYPVYATFDAEGVITEVTIKFVG